MTDDSGTEVKAPSGIRGKRWNYGWVVVVAYMAVDSMIHAIGFSLGVFLPPITDELGMSLGQAGWLGSFNWMVPALLGIPFASLLARFPPKRLIAVSILVGVPFVFLQGWAPNYWVLLVARVAFMSIVLGRVAARPKLIRQWFPNKTITIVNAVLTVGMGAAMATAVFWTGDLIQALDGWRNALYLFASLFALTGVGWIILGRENPTPVHDVAAEVPQQSPIRAVMKYKPLWLLGMGIAGDMLCFGAMETLWPKLAVQEGIMSLDRASYCLGLTYYGFMIGCLVGGIVSHRIGRRKPLLWLPGLFLPPLTLAILFSHSFAVLAVLWTVWGLSEVYFPIIWTIPYELRGIKTGEIAVAGAFVVSMFTAGAALGPLIAGYIADAFGSLKLGLAVTCGFPFLLVIAGILIPETGPAARRKTHIDGEGHQASPEETP
ncbi:MAG: CynX/NimT family MFS transporter [Chloroflexota bacterium]